MKRVWQAFSKVNDGYYAVQMRKPRAENAGHHFLLTHVTRQGVEQWP
jgi:hypothetical protein